jgi:hypothetical protein
VFWSFFWFLTYIHQLYTTTPIHEYYKSIITDVFFISAFALVLPTMIFATVSVLDLLKFVDVWQAIWENKFLVKSMWDMADLSKFQHSEYTNYPALLASWIKQSNCSDSLQASTYISSAGESFLDFFSKYVMCESEWPKSGTG